MSVDRGTDEMVGERNLYSSNAITQFVSTDLGDNPQGLLVLGGAAHFDGSIDGINNIQDGLEFANNFFDLGGFNGDMLGDSRGVYDDTLNSFFARLYRDD